jgi:hypothetical protein
MRNGNPATGTTQPAAGRRRGRLQSDGAALLWPLAAERGQPIGATGVGAAQGRGAADIMGDVTVYNPHGCWCDLGNTTGQGGIELIDVVVGCHHSASL